MRLLIALSLISCSSVGCAVSTDEPTPTKPHDPITCTVVESPMYVPTDGSYLVEASYGTIPIACPCDVGGGSDPVYCPYGSHPTDSMVTRFPAGGPNAEAVQSFILGPGECYEYVVCVTNAEPPTVTKL
jgi:hypothetical protein